MYLIGAARTTDGGVSRESDAPTRSRASSPKRATRWTAAPTPSPSTTTATPTTTRPTPRSTWSTRTCAGTGASSERLSSVRTAGLPSSPHPPHNPSPPPSSYPPSHPTLHHPIQHPHYINPPSIPLPLFLLPPPPSPAMPPYPSLFLPPPPVVVSSVIVSGCSCCIVAF